MTKIFQIYNNEFFLLRPKSDGGIRVKHQIVVEDSNSLLCCPSENSSVFVANPRPNLKFTIWFCSNKWYLKKFSIWNLKGEFTISSSRKMVGAQWLAANFVRNETLKSLSYVDDNVLRASAIHKNNWTWVWRKYPWISFIVQLTASVQLFDLQSNSIQVIVKSTLCVGASHLMRKFEITVLKSIFWWNC